MNGEMLAGLLETYIKNINDGTAPTIENAWSYICKTENAKALHEASKCYEKAIAMAGLPCDEDELKDIHKEAKEATMDLFHKKAVGDYEPYIRELKQLIQQKYNFTRTINEKESRRVSVEFLSENYKVIERKMKAGEF